MSLTRTDLESGLLQQMVLESKLGLSILTEVQLQASIRETLLQYEPNSDIWLFEYFFIFWKTILMFFD